MLRFHLASYKNAKDQIAPHRYFIYTDKLLSAVMLCNFRKRIFLFSEFSNFRKRKILPAVKVPRFDNVILINVILAKTVHIICSAEIA